MPDFGAYQNEIYFAGLSGRLPQFPMRFDELEAKAHAAMPESLVSYVAAGLEALSRVAQPGVGAAVLHAHGAGGCGGVGDRLRSDAGGVVWALVAVEKT